MASTFTPNVGIEQPANGDYINTWNVPVNNDWGIIDTVFGSTTNLSVTGQSGIVSLALSQYQPRIIIATGVLTANVNYQLPAGVGGTWSFFNNTSGAFLLTFSSGGAGTSVNVPQGYTAQVICNGTNVGFAQTAPTNPGGLSAQIQFNNGGLFAGSNNLLFDGTNTTVAALRFLGSSSGYVGFISAATATDIVWTLPSADGTSGQVLTTNGAGILSWQTVAGGGQVTSFNGRQGAVTLLSSDINTALGYIPAGLASPAFTGVPTAPTASPGTNTTQLATTAFVSGAGYVTAAQVAATYLTIANAASTYLTISGAASTYLTLSGAASTYLTQSAAASTYAPQSAFGGSIASNGYYSLPGGFVMQWFTVSVSPTGDFYQTGINFPHSFPTNCFGAWVTDTNNSTGGTSSGQWVFASPVNGTITSSGFTVSLNTNNSGITMSGSHSLRVWCIGA